MPDDTSFERAAYENPALWEEDYFESHEHARYQAIVEHLPQVARSLVDVGCGNGMFLKRLAEDRSRTWSRLAGVDRSVAALSRVVVEKHEGSVEALPFADGEFDIVTCQEVLEHLPKPVFEKALGELQRVSRRWIVVSVPYRENLASGLVACPWSACRFNPDFHLRAFDEAAMERLFSGYPFVMQELLRILPLKMLPDPLSRLARFGRRVAGRDAGLPPWYAVCPACGYRPARAQPGERSPSRPGRRLQLASLLRTKKTFRWMAAVFERTSPLGANAEG